MSPLAHDHLDKGLDVGPDPGRLCADAFWCPVGTEAVVCWHVITDGGMLPVALRPIAKLSAISRVDKPSKDRRKASRIFRIDNLFIGLSSVQNERQSSPLQITSQQRIKGWADAPESPGRSDRYGWAD